MTPGRRRLRLRLHRLAIALAVFYALWLMAGQQVKMWELERQIRATRWEIEQIRLQRAALERELEALQQPDGIAREARRRLGLVFPGEIPYVAVPAPESAAEEDRGAD